MLRNTLLCIVGVLFFTITTTAQEKLTNEDIVALTKSGLSSNVIVAKIKASGDVKFDTSTTALVALANAGVSDAVIALMVTRTGNAQENLADVPEQGSITDLKNLKEFFVVTNNLKARDRIAKELIKAGFVQSDKLETAKFFLYYQEWEEPVNGSIYNNKIGVLTVGIRLARDRRRNIYSSRKEKFYVFTPEPAEATAKQFVRDFKKI